MASQAVPVSELREQAPHDPPKESMRAFPSSVVKRSLAADPSSTKDLFA